MKTLEAKEEFIAHSGRQGLSKETIKWYSVYLTKFSNTYPDLPTDLVQIEEFIASYQSSDYSDYQRLRCSLALKAFYNYLSKRYDVANPMEPIPKPGHKPLDTQNETPYIYPDSIQRTGKTDDISAILRAFPHKDAAHHLASAKFYYHATLYNVGQQLIHVVQQYIEQDTLQDYMIKPLFDMVCIYGEVDCEDTDEEISAAVMREGKKLWKMELAFLESFVAEQYAKALEYKRLAGETTAIKEITVLNQAYYSFKISN